MKLFRSAFITGHPTAGKTWLAKKVCERTGAIHVGLDDLRAGMMEDSKLRSWARFFLDLDERGYWRDNSCQQHWTNVVAQAEAFWPVYRGRIQEILKDQSPAVFESIALLPHLVVRELSLPGICLSLTSFRDVLERSMRAPRWEATRELQEIESHMIYECERPAYEREAEKHGVPVFTDVLLAEEALVEMMIK